MKDILKRRPSYPKRGIERLSKNDQVAMLPFFQTVIIPIKNLKIEDLLKEKSEFLALQESKSDSELLTMLISRKLRRVKSKTEHLSNNRVMDGAVDILKFFENWTLRKLSVGTTEQAVAREAMLDHNGENYYDFIFEFLETLVTSLNNIDESNEYYSSFGLHDVKILLGVEKEEVFVWVANRNKAALVEELLPRTLILLKRHEFYQFVQEGMGWDIDHPAVVEVESLVFGRKSTEFIKTIRRAREAVRAKIGGKKKRKNNDERILRLAEEKPAADADDTSEVLDIPVPLLKRKDQKK